MLTGFRKCKTLHRINPVTGEILESVPNHPSHPYYIPEEYNPTECPPDVTMSVTNTTTNTTTPTNTPCNDPIQNLGFAYTFTGDTVCNTEGEDNIVVINMMQNELTYDPCTESYTCVATGTTVSFDYNCGTETWDYDRGNIQNPLTCLGEPWEPDAQLQEVVNNCCNCAEVLLGQTLTTINSVNCIENTIQGNNAPQDGELMQVSAEASPVTQDCNGNISIDYNTKNLITFCIVPSTHEVIDCNTGLTYATIVNTDGTVVNLITDLITLPANFEIIAEDCYTAPQNIK